MRYSYSVLLFFLINILVNAQTVQNDSERFPVFPACGHLKFNEVEPCFYQQVQNFVNANFVVPEKLQKSNYRGTILVLFEVTDKGEFKVQYVDAVDETLVTESKRVFGSLPIIAPATYNGKPTYAKYTIKINIPLQKASGTESGSDSNDAIKSSNSALTNANQKQRKFPVNLHNDRERGLDRRYCCYALENTNRLAT